MATTKKRTATKKKTTNKSQQKQPNHQISAIIILAVAVFMVALVIIPIASLGAVGGFAKKFLFWVLGSTSYVFPIVLGYIAFVKSRQKEKGDATATVVFACIFAFMLNTTFEAFAHTTVQNVSYWAYLQQSALLGLDNFSGGVLGGILSYPLILWLGVTLARVTAIILVVAALMITTGITLLTISRAAKKTGEKVQEIHNQTKERIAQKRENAKFNPDISLDGMPEHPQVIDELYAEKEKAKRKNTRKKAEKLVDVYHDDTVDEIPEVNDKKPVANTNEKPKKEAEQKSAKKIDIPEDMPKKAVTASEYPDYKFPPLELLQESKHADKNLVEAELNSNCELLVNVLKSFGVEVRVTGYSRGPSVTRYEVQPSVGVRINKITNLADDIALQLRAASVRISPIPNKSAIGIEVPNTNSAIVGMRDILNSSEFTRSKSKLSVALGRDVTGNIVVCDVAKMPHLLVAGTTGSGKSVCLNSMIMSILYRANPDEVKFVMIDPKAVEFRNYNGIPHLLVPVVTDPRKAAGALGWAVVEMEKRYALLAEQGVRNIQGYNDLCKSNPDLSPMPQIVIIIDEFADLMMVAGSEVETSVCRIAQKARAAGMHLVIATQRPSSDIFTGLIKSNIPSAIALKVANQVNSQIIIDTGGAEKLMGNGDMLYAPVGIPKPLRVQGCFVSDGEVENVIDFIKKECEETEYDESVIAEIERQAVEDKKGGKQSSNDDEAFGDFDSRINEAIEVVVENGMASTSLLQRKLKLGYSRAARIIDQMEEKGIIGPFEGSKPRKVLIDKQAWLEMQTSGNTSFSSAENEPKSKQLPLEEVVEEKNASQELDNEENEEFDNTSSAENSVEADREADNQVDEAIPEIEHIPAGQEFSDDDIEIDDDFLRNI